MVTELLLEVLFVAVQDSGELGRQHGMSIGVAVLEIFRMEQKILRLSHLLDARIVLFRYHLQLHHLLYLEGLLQGNT